MKPFNLERALAGDPVVTRDGRKVTQLMMFDASALAKPVAGVIHGVCDVVFSWTKNGYSSIYPGAPLLDDLFMASVKREGWIIVRSPDEDGICKTSDLYPSPDVLYAHNPELIHCWIRKIEWEE